MVDLHPQFVTDASGKRIAVQLSMDEFEKLLEEAEMAADIAMYDAAKAAGIDAVRWEDVVEELRRAP